MSRTVHGRIQHAALCVAEPQAVDPQGIGQELLGQLQRHSPHPQRLAGKRFDSGRGPLRQGGRRSGSPDRQGQTQ